MPHIHLKGGGGGDGPPPYDPHGTVGKPEINADETILEFVHELIITCVLMTVFVLFETWQHHKHCRFGHAAGLIFLVGIGVSVGTYHGDVFLTPFSYVALFDFAIPFILFNDGYNMRKKYFLKELSNVCIQGIISTFIGMTMSIVALYFVMKLDFVRQSFHWDRDQSVW